MATTTANRFTDVATSVGQCQQNQRNERLLDGIVEQMQQSSNPQTQQLGEELRSAKPQLIRALQQS